MDEERFVGGEIELGADGFGRARDGPRGKEIVDDLDGAVGTEDAMGFLFEETRDGGDGVGTDERVANGRAVAGVPTEEGGVGAVEGGDEFGATLGREHFEREDRGGGVGDGVVDVKDVEGEVAGDFGHLDGERERVVGVFEEIVVVDNDGVEEDASGVDGDAERAFVTDEMDLVSTARELFAERGSEDAGAADGGVASDADFQRAGGHGGTAKGAKGREGGLVISEVADDWVVQMDSSLRSE